MPAAALISRRHAERLTPSRHNRTPDPVFSLSLSDAFDILWSIDYLTGFVFVFMDFAFSLLPAAVGQCMCIDLFAFFFFLMRE
jgi:hypothetical protein